MSWRRARQFTRTLSFRLNLWHACVFLVSTTLLFTLIYFLLRGAFDRADRDPLEARLRDAASVYRESGLDGLGEWEIRLNDTRLRKFFVRLVRADGMVLLMRIPQNFEADLAWLLRAVNLPERAWMRIPRDREDDLTIASTRLADGTLLQIGRMTDSLTTLLTQVRQAFLLLTVPALLLGFFGGGLLANRMLRPVGAIINAASEIIGTGRMDVRVPTLSSNDELQELATLFNRLLEHNEKLVRALRESLDNVAHDLRTPLARLRATLEESLRNRPLDRIAAQDAIAGALEESERVESILNTLVDVALAESGLMKLQLAEADVGMLVEDAVELYEHVAQDKNVSVRNMLEGPLLAHVDRGRMRQVFANLLDNAVKYTPPGGEVSISGQRQNGLIELRFQDTGAGISKTDLPRIWERLYRGDKSRNEHGFGLGLSLVKAVVGAHRGGVEVASSEGKGSEFRIYLPAS